MRGTPGWYERTGLGYLTLTPHVECPMPSGGRGLQTCYRPSEASRAPNRGCVPYQPGGGAMPCTIGSDAGSIYCCPESGAAATAGGAAAPAGGAAPDAEGDKVATIGWEGLFSIPEAAANVAKAAVSSVTGGGEEGGEAGGGASVWPYVVIGGAALAVAVGVWALLRWDERKFYRGGRPPERSRAIVPAEVTQ